MFDISWSELLILAVVTLIFVGPKDLPRFLAMVGRYAGAVRRHANDFRQVFDQAMREAELDQVKREVDGMRDDVARSMREADKSVREGAPTAGATVPPAQSVPLSETAAAEQVPVEQAPITEAPITQSPVMQAPITQVGIEHSSAASEAPLVHGDQAAEALPRAAPPGGSA